MSAKQAPKLAPTELAAFQERDAEPAPLDPADRLGRSFKAAMAAVRRLRGRESHHPGELSDAQYGLLFCLRSHADLPSSELALAADLSAASTTEMLDGLATAGLVTRARSQRDRRVVLTSLTERGRELVEARRARYEPRWRGALAEFSEQDLIVAATVLDRLRGLFDELAAEQAEPGGRADRVA
jgi:MarR family transcriptional regulator, organic hydroperoxide resistance regulator